MLPSLDANTRDWAQAASWVIAAIGGVFAVLKIIYELGANRSQRADELRWKKAQAAKTLSDEMFEHGPTNAALIMLDWDGREFEIKPAVRAKITTSEFLTALRITNLNFSDTEIFVRDAFDGLFYHMGVFEHYISRGLIDFEDVKHPLDYYIAKLAAQKRVFVEYLQEYRFERSARFLQKFEAWKDSPEVSLRDLSQ